MRNLANEIHICKICLIEEKEISEFGHEIIEVLVADK